MDESIASKLTNAVPTTAQAERRRALSFLVVDDDPDQTEVMSVILTDYFPDARIHCLASGAELETVEPAEFDLGIFDLQLPDCTGLDLIHKVHGICDLPIIMVTGERFGQAAADAIRAGASDYIVKHGDYIHVVPVVIEKVLAQVEMKRIKEALEHELLERNRELERLNEQLREMAAHDALTRLYNRRHFQELLHQLFSEAVRYDADLTCMMVDLDHFKQVNDTLGHPTGDRVLVLAASVIRRVMRQSDLSARYGGDEFVVLLPRTTPSDARASAVRLVATFRRELLQKLPQAAGVTLSVGLASREQGQPRTADALVKLADQALYLAKEAGRDRIMVVNPVEVATSQP